MIDDKLEHLGYPKPIRTGEEDTVIYHKPRYSIVMRLTARALELIGDDRLELAEGSSARKEVLAEQAEL